MPALNRGKPEVPFKTLRSFGKYLEMWKFHYFLNTQVFFQRPKLCRDVCQTDKVPGTEKYTNVSRTHWCFEWKRSLHHKCFTSAVLTPSFWNWFLARLEKSLCFLVLESGKWKSEIKLLFAAFFDRFCPLDLVSGMHWSFSRPSVKFPFPEIKPIV